MLTSSHMFEAGRGSVSDAALPGSDPLSWCGGNLIPRRQASAAKPQHERSASRGEARSATRQRPTTATHYITIAANTLATAAPVASAAIRGPASIRPPLHRFTP